jgi:hypothetical protein
MTPLTDLIQQMQSVEEVRVGKKYVVVIAQMPKENVFLRADETAVREYYHWRLNCLHCLLVMMLMMVMNSSSMGFDNRLVR